MSTFDRPELATVIRNMINERHLYKMMSGGTDMVLANRKRFTLNLDSLFDDNELHLKLKIFQKSFSITSVTNLRGEPVDDDVKPTALHVYFNIPLEVDDAQLIYDLVTMMMNYDYEGVKNRIAIAAEKCPAISEYNFFMQVIPPQIKNVEWRRDTDLPAPVFISAKEMLTKLMRISNIAKRVAGSVGYDGYEPKIYRFTGKHDPVIPEIKERKGKCEIKLETLNTVKYEYDCTEISTPMPVGYNTEYSMEGFPLYMANLTSTTGQIDMDKDRLIGISIDMDNGDEPDGSVFVVSNDFDLTPDDIAAVRDQYCFGRVPKKIMMVDSPDQAEMIKIKGRGKIASQISELMKNGAIPMFWLNIAGAGKKNNISCFVMARNSYALQRILEDE